MLLCKLSSPFQKKMFTRGLSLSRRDQNLCWPKPDYGPTEVMRSDLMNGAKVASAKAFGAQIAACTIMYQAGSRYERDDTIGASHFLRAMSMGSGCGFTSYIKSRYMQQSGGSLTCSSDRQSVAFTLRCPVTCFTDLKSYLLDTAARYFMSSISVCGFTTYIKSRYMQQSGGSLTCSSDRQSVAFTLRCPVTCFTDLKSYLLDTAARCCYHQWEIDDCKSLIKDDLLRITPEQMVMDLIQKASFTGPLANSVFCPEERIKGMTQDSMLRFVNANFKPVRCTVGSVGVRFEEAQKMAERIDLNRERKPDPCTVVSYPRTRGYEYHDLGAGSETWIAVAVPGCGSCDLGCLLKHNIVAAACGTTATQRGQHNLDRTAAPPLGTMAGNDVHTTYRAFNISFFDIGIFGILAKTRASTATQVAQSAAEFLANVGDLNFQQIAAGKRRLSVLWLNSDWRVVANQAAPCEAYHRKGIIQPSSLSRQTYDAVARESRDLVRRRLLAEMSLALHDGDCVKVAEGLALQIANGLQFDNARVSMGLVDLIPPDEVVTTARTLSGKSCRMSMAVVGDVGAVPPGTELL